MSGFSDYDLYDAFGLAELVRAKQVSAKELLEEAFKRCDKVNAQLNAVVYRCDEKALEATALLSDDMPFAGVPFLLKDLGPPLKGAPLTSGSRFFKDFIPASDGELVWRFKRAGFLPFGKTNVPEFGLLPVTEPELFGPCHNPWDLSRTPGGSSGGAAAAVAARIVPVAHASDGGGSIRIPASCCGLFGLKTSRGLNPTEVPAGLLTENFGVDHVITRSVRDSAAVLDAVSNKPNAHFLRALHGRSHPLRVGIVRSVMMGSALSPDVQRALDHTVSLLKDCGHDVRDAEPKVDYPDLATAFLIYWAVGASQTLQNLDMLAKLKGGALDKDDVEVQTWALGKLGQMLREADLVFARTAFWRATKTFNDFFNTYDVLVSPVLAKPPLSIGEHKLAGWKTFLARAVAASSSPWLAKKLLQSLSRQSFEFASFTAPFNITGQPAASVPLYWTETGLPIGIQIAARMGADSLVLQLAHQLELAQPWTHRVPKVWAGEKTPKQR